MDVDKAQPGTRQPLALEKDMKFLVGRDRDLLHGAQPTDIPGTVG